MLLHYGDLYSPVLPTFIKQFIVAITVSFKTVARCKKNIAFGLELVDKSEAIFFYGTTPLLTCVIRGALRLSLCVLTCC